MQGIKFRVLLRCAFCSDEWYISRWDFDRPVTHTLHCRECNWKGMVPVVLLDEEQ